MQDTSTYESPFCTRYASKEMQYVFSADKKIYHMETSLGGTGKG